MLRVFLYKAEGKEDHVPSHNKRHASKVKATGQRGGAEAHNKEDNKRA